MLGDGEKLGSRTEAGRLLPLRGVVCTAEAVIVAYSLDRLSVVGIVNNEIVLLMLPMILPGNSNS